MIHSALRWLFLLGLVGCGHAPMQSSPPPTPARAVGGESPPIEDSSADITRLTFRVTKAVEHLGHSTEFQEGATIHPLWIDGCRGEIVPTEEAFMVWWNGGEIRGYPFKFEDGETYILEIRGELDGAVMGYEGKCVHVSKVAKVEASPGRQRE
jgi:hypothetical protein